MPIRYDIKDSQTGRIVASAKTRDAAHRSADRRDAAYGAVRYIVLPVWAD